MSKAIDCGTGNFIVASNDGSIDLQRNAFISVDKTTSTTRQLKLLKVPFIDIRERLYIVGKAAFEYAQVFNTAELRRPMAKGLLNPLEQDALPILKFIIGGLIGKPAPGLEETVVYCVPGTPLDQEREIDYHADVLKSIIEFYGYKARPINEAVALGLAGLADDSYTGIAISMGAGMCNIAIIYAGMSALQFSVSKGGDWIDQQVHQDTGVTPAKAQYIKEAGDYTIDPVSTVDRIPEQQAIKTYYESLIRYLLANIARQFESKDMPDFPNAVPIIIGGGTAMVNGFIDVFKEQFNAKHFPLDISEIRLVDEPLTAVARGCLLDAQLEEDDDEE